MPIPFLLIGLGLGAAGLGIGKSIKAGIDQKDAKETNEYAQSVSDSAKEAAEKSRKNSGKAINSLGYRKIEILNDSIGSFINSFEKLHRIELSDSGEFSDYQNLKMDEQSFCKLKEMNTMASSLLGGAASGAMAGAVTAFGAYGAAMTFGACATTGTAISTLSGAVLTNATLAFLGGGALSAGGLGMAGGTAVLGGLVAGPALAVLGFVVGAKASKNKDEAYANLAKAEEFEEEMKTVRVLCNAIRMRANMFERTLLKLNALFCPLVYSMEKIIENRGTNFSTFTYEEKSVVASALATANAIKSVLDTPILTEDGNLTKESEKLSESVQKVLCESNG